MFEMYYGNRYITYVDAGIVLQHPYYAIQTCREYVELNFPEATFDPNCVSFRGYWDEDEEVNDE